MTFTVEEASLIDALDHTSREAVMLDIAAQLPYAKDTEFKDICMKTAAKLDRMSDEEFINCDFTLDYEEEEI